MKRLAALLAVLALGNATVHALGLDLGKALGAVADLGKAAAVGDDQVRAMGRELREHEEQTVERVAPESDPQAERLARLCEPFRSYDGMELNYKVYLGPQIGANSTPDGSIRVYVGLMEMVTDDELLFVLGHEIGHLKAGHPAQRLRTGLTTGALAKAAGVAGGGRVPTAQMGGLVASAIKGQHSQAQEIEADDYGVRFLKENGRDPAAAGTFLRKLANVSNGDGTVFSAHPDPVHRAERLGM